MTRRPAAGVVAGAEFGPMIASIDRARLRAYAGASGDDNPIHRDDEFARAVGLPGVIAHGMWTMGAAIEAVTDWVGDPTAVVDYATKFTAPVVVPATGAVTIEVRGRVKSVTLDPPSDPRAVVELTVTCAGEQVLNRAQATVRLAQGGAEPADA